MKGKGPQVTRNRTQKAKVLSGALLDIQNIFKVRFENLKEKWREKSRHLLLFVRPEKMGKYWDIWRIGDLRK